ncbi:RagB/SusD family nutrient uptake outer membrane protein [Flammeovirga agarivorans]|uniref:RagB/SusD family nutrient uptake outer membrane protein n=1 Tax=Flammeovirga agarivorans TaxID=2726742 RepID=A0A7X8SID0_9BACT|nr:RagB/SusD family nutrient uptake outer membrane protein [Flammeovirga agarivorans]NLR90804.1 RagB/SusD family nutrient uptake outer membrane protein [Flammeovirga agarivorans]
MKIYSFKKLLAVLSASAMLTACSSDFLDVEPYGKSDTSTYYQTDDEIDLALTASYDMLSSDQLQGWSSCYVIKNLPADDVNCGGGGASDQAQYQEIDDFEWHAENAGIRAFYHINYYGIYRVNQIITNAPTEGRSDLMNRMIAEAKFLRAYFYFELVTAFGDVPLWLEPPVELTEGKERTPKAEVYAQIEQDLTEAAEVLPNKSVFDGTGDAFRANKQAALGLLGKVRVFQGDFAGAIAPLESVLQVEGSEVALESDFSQLTLKSTEFGKESLFEASFISNLDTWGTTQWNRDAHDNRHIQLSGPRQLDDIEGATPIKSDKLRSGWGFLPPTQSLFDSFEATDGRRDATILDDEGLARLYGQVFTDGWDTEGLVRTKYTTFDSETTDEGGATPELNYTTNWRLLRFADVILLAAEAYYEQGNESDARAMLNKLRQRAGGLADYDATVTGDALFNAIMNERRVELAYEGSRFWDLVRWGLADEKLKDRGFQKGKHELFPIPLAEIVGNPGITSADQNPGY